MKVVIVRVPVLMVIFYTVHWIHCPVMGFHCTSANSPCSCGHCNLYMVRGLYVHDRGFIVCGQGFGCPRSWIHCAWSGVYMSKVMDSLFVVRGSYVQGHGFIVCVVEGSYVQGHDSL